MARGARHRPRGPALVSSPRAAARAPRQLATRAHPCGAPGRPAPGRARPPARSSAPPPPPPPPRASGKRAMASRAHDAPARASGTREHRITETGRRSAPPRARRPFQQFHTPRPGRRPPARMMRPRASGSQHQKHSTAGSQHHRRPRAAISRARAACTAACTAAVDDCPPPPHPRPTPAPPRAAPTTTAPTPAPAPSRSSRRSSAPAAILAPPQRRRPGRTRGRARRAGRPSG
jgi:hypothetical protein